MECFVCSICSWSVSDTPIHDLSSNDLEMEAANLSVLDTEESITRKPAIILQR